MPDTPSITLVSSFTYKGAYEEWSNKYHFSGTVPADQAAWTALAIAIADAVKLGMRDTVTIRRAFGYVAGNENAVALVDFATVAGGLRVGVLGATTYPNQATAPGDETVMIRWKTSAVTSKAKPIYLRKFIHGAVTDINAETIKAEQKTALTTFAAKMYDGTLPGGVKYCGPQGAVVVSHVVMPYATVRQLRRRGKRTPTP